MKTEKELKQWLKGYLEELYGIILLEHNNKNHLSGDEASRSRTKKQLCEWCLEKVGQIEQLPAQHNFIKKN